MTACVERRAELTSCFVLRTLPPERRAAGVRSFNPSLPRSSQYFERYATCIYSERHWGLYTPRISCYATRMDNSVDDYNEKFSQLARVADTARARVPIPRTEKFSRAEVVHAITGVFEMIGGLPRFALWAHENPTEYYRIYAKLLPSQQQVTVAHEHSGEVRLLSDSELTDIVHEERTGGRTFEHDNE